MKKTLITFALLASASRALAGPSTLPTNVLPENPALHRSAPPAQALVGQEPRRDLRQVTASAGNGGSIRIPVPAQVR